MLFEVGQGGALVLDEAGHGAVEELWVVVLDANPVVTHGFGDDHYTFRGLVGVHRALGVGSAIFSLTRRQGVGGVGLGQAEGELAAQGGDGLHGRLGSGEYAAGGKREGQQGGGLGESGHEALQG